MARNEIVVGLDTSPSAKAALSWAAQYARETGFVLRAIHVLDWPVGDPAHRAPVVNGLVSLPEHGTDSAFATIMRRELEAVDPLQEWSVQFAEGEAGRELVRHSTEAKLLVIGTREHVGLERLMAGSVSHYCLSHAACPVVAVPVIEEAGPVPGRATVRGEKRD